jgi:hypothetical protein
MLSACRKRPLSTGVPQADLMLFLRAFSWVHDQIAQNTPKLRIEADIVRFIGGKVTNE